MANNDVLVLKKPSPKRSHVKGAKFLTSRLAIDKALRGGPSRPGKASTWLVLDADSALMLLDKVQTFKARTFGTLVVLEDITPSRLALANRYFKTVFQRGLSWLPAEQIIRILHLPEPKDRLVCGLVDEEAGNLLVYGGDLEPVVAPLSSFQPRAAVKPDFQDFEVIDGGNAVRFGEYEAAADAILYEHDGRYRSRLRHRRFAEENTFGASLRRLRLQRELRQTDFEPEVSAKTIARLENHQVDKPHGETLRQIAERLDVQPEEIETY